jgi:hypothetical protein
VSPVALKGVGIGCFVACAILLFVAWERYQDNANKVEAANKLLQSSPLGGMMDQMKSSPLGGAMGPVLGGAKMEPGMPDSTKYALFIAALTAIGGVVCIVLSAKAGVGGASQQTKPPST